MKKIRHLLSIFLIAVLALTLSLPAYAEGSIVSVSSAMVSGGEKDDQGGGSLIRKIGTAADLSESDGEEASSRWEAVLSENEELSYEEIFVSIDGNDETGDGSRELPFATLSHAAEAANGAASDTVYIVLLSDIVSTRLARFYDKHIILVSDAETQTVTRGSGFEPAYDSVRGAYQPAMLECGRVEGTDRQAAVITLANVILDDAGLQEGSSFATQQTASETEENLDFVQDAILAAYDGGAGIILQSGSELRNYGGLSAVYLGSGCSLRMESDSAIRDTTELPLQEGQSAVLAESGATDLREDGALVMEHGEPLAEAADTQQELTTALPDRELSLDDLTEREYSSLEFTAPESVTRLEDGILSYDVPYTLLCSLTDSAQSMIEAAAELIQSGRGSITVTLDERLSVKGGEDVAYSFESAVFEIVSVSSNGKVITAEFQLKDGWRERLDKLTEPMSFCCTGVLARDQFEDDAYLISKADVTLVLRTDSKSMDLSSGEKEAQTKMLPPPSAFVRYDANGGEGAPEAELVSAQTAYKLNTETVPTHADENGKPVVFIGWTTEKDTRIYAEKDDAPETVETVDVEALSDTSVYAVYGYDENEDGIADVIQELVTLSYDANGGEGAPDSETKVAVAGVGAKFDISETEPSRRYYTFQGWSKEQDATEADYKYDADKKADQDLLITKDTTLYAVWEQNPTYTLYYNANGGTNAPAAQSAISENNMVELTITSQQPTRSGYSFTGWAATRTGSAEYFAGDEVRITNGNVILYAVWQKNASGTSGGSGSGSGSNSSAPRTGDTSSAPALAVLSLLSLASCMVLTVLAVKGKKKA